MHDKLWNDSPHIAIVAAHPDDEVIGAGALMMWLESRGRARVEVLYVTDGAPRDMLAARAAGFDSREAYASARAAEAAAALRHAGIASNQCRRLGLIDQEASLDLAALARYLAARLKAGGIDVVITHPYEGGHPDHDATAFAVHTAVRLLCRNRHPHPPVVYEMTSYHAGPEGIRTGEFLPPPGPIVMVPLSRAERMRKRAMLTCFATQWRARHTVADLECERFRPAPPYRFDEPPHAGRLWYEGFNWGMDGARWRQLATHALAQLRLEAV